MSLSNDEAIRVGLEAMDSGANAVYTATHSFKRVEAMADVGIPVVGHVGFVPSRVNWIGGPRAAGKTADEALKVWEATKNYENAGAIAIEIEVVPEKIATEITKRTKMLTLSLGSGKGCDGEYLWAEDILGTHEKHYPATAKIPRPQKRVRPHPRRNGGRFQGIRRRRRLRQFSRRKTHRKNQRRSA